MMMVYALETDLNYHGKFDKNVQATVVFVIGMSVMLVSLVKM